MKFDISQKYLEISIRDLVYSVRYSKQPGYLSRRLRAKIGQDAHHSYQKDIDRKNTEYYVKFNRKVKVKDKFWSILVRGRADVVYRHNDQSITIEEIKSIVDRSQEDSQELNEAHIRQLQLYAYYFREYEDIENIDAYLVLIDAINNTETKVRVEEDHNKSARFIREQSKEIIESILEYEAYQEQRRDRLSLLTFPFETHRPYQKEIMERIEKGLQNKQQIMLSAPPGIGKTLSSLYPALKVAIANNMKIFCVTSKTTQQLIYKQTLELLVEKGADLNAIIITAKAKVCHTERYNCEENVCELQDRIYNMDTGPIVEDVLELKVIDRDIIDKEAKIYEICPFELSLDVSLECDIIVCDFNYLFHPRSGFQRQQINYENSIVIVDEAHNLPPRANDYYSEKISAREVKEIIDMLYTRRNWGISSNTINRGKATLFKLYRMIQGLKEQVVTLEFSETSLVSFDIKRITQIQKDFDDFIIQYINELPEDMLQKDEIIVFSDKFKFFEMLARESVEEEFSQLYDVDGNAMRILCKSSAKKLYAQFSNFGGVVVQSATIKPFDYFSHILGLDPDKLEMLDYPSPFPKQNQLHLVHSAISTRYDDRDFHLRDLVDLIHSVTSLRTGNYLAFFPSFAFLLKVKTVLEQMHGDSIEIMVQGSNMSDLERKDFLEELRGNQDRTIVLMAVMGGVFSEGVDFLKHMAIGAFVVGPGLPSYTFDQELKKKYFDKLFGLGFEYAYRNPGMIKVIQAAGRVFRTTTDRGFVLLVGRRFNTEFYRKELPSYWDLVSAKDPAREVQNFWHSFD